NTQMVSDTFGPSITLLAGDTILNLKTTLISLKPSYASGYLSSQSMDQQGSEYIGIGENIRSGTILLDSVKMTMDVKNYIGADERVNFTQIRSVNDGSGSTVDLTAPGFINHTTNINRALETGPYPSPVIPSTYSVTLDRSNSNIREILENLPDRIEYNLNMDLNPLGNVSGYSDFIYTHQLIEAKMRFEMPLRFAASQLVISDTLDINSTSFTNLDPVGPSDMTLWAENGFPFDLDLKIFLQDHSGSITDSLPVTGMIQQGLINPVTLKVVSPKTTVLPFRVDESRKQKIMNASGLLIRATMHTPFFPSPIQIFSDYKLDLRLVAEGIYTIR
ncbi:MAG: hypothetical protein IT242_11665, partial [Bacteroidia bacterium]|nr:hypothetical protein [Bacteroidia bacterium]